MHSSVFGAFDVADIAWFGSFAVATAFLAAMAISVMRSAGSRSRATV